MKKTAEQLAVTLRECAITLPESIELVARFQRDARAQGMRDAAEMLSTIKVGGLDSFATRDACRETITAAAEKVRKE